MRPVWRWAAGGAHIGPARPLHSRGTGAPAPRTAGSGRGGRGTSCTWLGSRPFRHKRSSRRPSAPPRAHAVSASCPSRDAGAHGARARTALTPPESVNQPGPDTADAVLSAKGLISPCGQRAAGKRHGARAGHPAPRQPQVCGTKELSGDRRPCWGSRHRDRQAHPDARGAPGSLRRFAGDLLTAGHCDVHGRVRVTGEAGRGVSWAGMGLRRLRDPGSGPDEPRRCESVREFVTSP